MIQTTTDYTMTVDDMAAFRALLKLQADVGPGMPPPGQTQLWDLFSILDNMAYDHYRLTSISQLKSWMDAIFNAVISSDTCYTIDGKNLTAAGLYVLYMYYQFNATCMTKGDFIFDSPWGQTGFPANALAHNSGASLPYSNEGLGDAWPWNWFGPTGLSIFLAPTTVPFFFDAYNQNAQLLHHGLVLQKGSTATVALTTNIDEVNLDMLNKIQQFEQSRFDPANWKDSNLFVQALQQTTVWKEQSGTVTSLLKEPALTADAYLYLFYLLIGLGTSGSTDQQLAQKTVNAPVSSMEYPNDTLINQLLYCILMYFADPLGDYNYDNMQLQGWLNDISNIIVSTDPASAAIKQGITKSLKILHSDSAYPTQDLYNSNIGFNTRQADTLAALDIARSGLT